MTSKRDLDPTMPADLLPPEPDAPAPTNVVAALARVEAELDGVPKLTPAQRGRVGPDAQGVKYAYRGIDDISNAARPLFAKYGVVIVPISTDSVGRQVNVGSNNALWDHMLVTVRWAIYGPGGPDDKILAESIGEGRDNSDKAANKAFTGAYKNLLLKMLCIGDPDDDPDGQKATNSEPGDDLGEDKLAEQQAALRFSQISDGAVKAAVQKQARETLGVSNVMRSGANAAKLFELICQLDPRDDNQESNDG